MRFVPAVPCDIRENLHLDGARFLGSRTETRPIYTGKIRKVRSDREPEGIRRTGVPRSRQYRLVALPVIDIRLREPHRNLAIFRNIARQEYFVTPLNVYALVGSTPLRAHEHRNRGPSQLLVLAKLHVRPEHATAFFREADVLFPGQRPGKALPRRVVLRIRPHPASLTDHVHRIGRRHKIRIVLPGHEHHHAFRRMQYNLAKSPLAFFLQVVRQRIPGQVDCSRRLVKNFHPSGITAFMVFVVGVYRIHFAELKSGIFIYRKIGNRRRRRRLHDRLYRYRFIRFHKFRLVVRACPQQHNGK